MPTTPKGWNVHPNEGGSGGSLLRAHLAPRWVPLRRSFPGAALALEPELALLPQDVLGGEGAELGDAQAGVEQGPDDEAFGGGLARVGEPVGLVGGERLAGVLV